MVAFRARDARTRSVAAQQESVIQALWRNGGQSSPLSAQRPPFGRSRLARSSGRARHRFQRLTLRVRLATAAQAASFLAQGSNSKAVGF